MIFFTGFEKLGVFRTFFRELISGGDLGAGSGHYERQDYGSAYKVFKKYESRSNDNCHGCIKYYLALAYFYGHGVKQNKQLSDQFFLESAALGNKEAIEYISKSSINDKKH